MNPLRRFRAKLFFITSLAVFPLLAASALVLVSASVFGGISWGSSGPIYIALALVGLALLLTLACLAVLLLLYIIEADRQETAGILLGASGGALTSFVCARIYPAWDVSSLLLFAVARVALTDCQRPYWRRRHTVKPVAPGETLASFPDPSRRRRRRLPDAVVVGAGVAYGFAAMVGLGLASTVQAGIGLTWLGGIGGGFAFLFFLLSTQGLLAIVHDGVTENVARWRAKGH